MLRAGRLNARPGLRSARRAAAVPWVP